MKRIMRMRLVTLLLSFTFLWGCELAWMGVGAGLGIGTYRYIEGGVEKGYPLAYNLAWDVTNTALANLHISVSNSINEGVRGSIEAVRRDGTKVEINLKDRGQNITAIHVRVGFFGNREEAERIHEEIKTVAKLK